MVGGTGKWEKYILEQLDQCASDYAFPMLNNIYISTASIRLKAYLSDTEWLIIFEHIVLVVEGFPEFENEIYAYGNEVAEPGMQQPIICVSAQPDQSIWDDDGHFLLSKWDFTVLIKGKEHHFTPTRRDYEMAGIDPDSDMEDAVQILRFLSFKIPSVLFASDSELLEICGRADAGLEKFIEVNDWYHPNLADDEMPSESPCLNTLALALAKGNKELYECPEDKHNTHWSNWDLESE